MLSYFLDNLANQINKQHNLFKTKHFNKYYIILYKFSVVNNTVRQQQQLFVTISPKYTLFYYFLVFNEFYYFKPDDVGELFWPDSPRKRKTTIPPPLFEPYADGYHLGTAMTVYIALIINISI